MSLWQELEELQRKKAEVQGQIHSFGEQVSALEERMKTIEGGLGIQEERMHTLETLLKDKHEAISKLESKATGLEKILKKPAKEEPIKEESIVEASAKEETAEQPMEVTVQAATGGSQRQTEEPQEKQKGEKKRKRWL